MRQAKNVGTNAAAAGIQVGMYTVRTVPMSNVLGQGAMQKPASHRKVNPGTGPFFIFWDAHNGMVERSANQLFAINPNPEDMSLEYHSTSSQMLPIQASTRSAVTAAPPHLIVLRMRRCGFISVQSTTRAARRSPVPQAEGHQQILDQRLTGIAPHSGHFASPAIPARS
jgi:hypothetical protein